MSRREITSRRREQQLRPSPAPNEAPLDSVSVTTAAAASLTDAVGDQYGPLGRVFDAIPDGIILADESGQIHYVNRQAEVLFGYRGDELTHRPVEALMPERFRAVHPSHRDRYRADPHVRPMGTGLRLFGRRRDGTEFPVEISLSPISVDDVPLILATIRDVTEQRRLERVAREELEARLAMLQAILDELPTGAYLVRGDDARLVLANRRVAELWGAEWRDGQPMADFLAASGTRVYDAAGHELALEQLATVRALRTGQSVRQMHEVLWRSNGSRLPVQVDAVALEPGVFPYLSEVHTRTSDPTPIALVVHQDVSSLKEAERLKDEFIALAAHELRNPVASLTGYAHMLLRRPREAGSAQQRRAARAARARAAAEEAVQEEALAAVAEAANRLTTLTDDLLDATRLHANQLALQLEPIELGALVRRVVRRLQVTTPISRHPMHVQAPTDPVLVMADARRIEQVLVNLLANAVKYSPDGGAIDIALTPHFGPSTAPAAEAVSGADGGMASGPDDAPAEPGRNASTFPVARVLVRDHGMGIPLAQQARIFGRFARAANALQAAIPGTGLGLYLCRELLDRQGGRIWFESAEGTGSAFTFELPLLVDPPDDYTPAGA